MVAFDANVLMVLVDSKANPTADPTTGQPLPYYRERIEYLIETLEKEKSVLVLPTPALAEVLVKVDNIEECLKALSAKKFIRIANFDSIAAVECAQAMKKALDQNGRLTEPDCRKSKVKFDRQIIAIAKAQGVKTIYSDDSHIQKYAKDEDIVVIQTQELPLPQETAQLSFVDQLAESLPIKGPEVVEDSIVPINPSHEENPPIS